MNGLSAYSAVMPGLVPGIHDFLAASKTSMAAMTIERAGRHS
jgi:hypothetical protein